MTIIQKINIFIKRKYNNLSLIDFKALRFQKFNPFFLISFLVVFSTIFFISSNFLNKIKKDNVNNVKEITETTEFSNLKNFFIRSYHNELSPLYYFEVKKNSLYLYKNMFKYFFRTLSYLLILNLKGSLKNLSKLLANIKYIIK